MSDIVDGTTSKTTSRGLMLPPQERPLKRKREQKVLDEDEWTDKLEAIIQRDYFPDIPKLENELEWLEAIRTKDPATIRQAQSNIAQRRAGLKTPMGQSPATFATPGTGLRRAGIGAPGSTPADFASTPATQAAGRGDTEAVEAAPDMSLDAFMATHTSEDNASFAEILEGINKRKRERHAWLHNQIKEKEVKLLEDARPNDGFGTTGQPDAALLPWPYEAKNQLYYHKEGLPFSEKELTEQVQGPPKQIRAPNTRIHTTAADDQNLQAEARAVRGEGYAPVATPSLVPGGEESPFMTWGELGATPLRLDEGGGGVRVTEVLERGPRYSMPERNAKELVAERLADSARLNLQKRAALMSPSAMLALQRRTPSRSKLGQGRSWELGAGMSPAAHRLASSMRGKKDVSTSDNYQLRASYSAVRKLEAATPRTTPIPSGACTPAITHTPAILRDENPTPSRRSPSSEEGSVREAALKSFEHFTVRRQALKANRKLTDNLLNF